MLAERVTYNEIISEGCPYTRAPLRSPGTSEKCMQTRSSLPPLGWGAPPLCWSPRGAHHAMHFVGLGRNWVGPRADRPPSAERGLSPEISPPLLASCGPWPLLFWLCGHLCPADSLLGPLLPLSRAAERPPVHQQRTSGIVTGFFLKPSESHPLL